MTTVVLAEDHPRARNALRHLLSSQEDFAIVGEASDGIEALELVRSLRPDVLVSDVMMPGQTALQFMEGLKRDHAGVRVVIVTNYFEGPYIHQLLKIGAVAYVDKGSCPDHLVPAVRAAMAGRQYLSPKSLENLDSEWGQS